MSGVPHIHPPPQPADPHFTLKDKMLPALALNVGRIAAELSSMNIIPGDTRNLQAVEIHGITQWGSCL